MGPPNILQLRRAAQSRLERQTQSWHLLWVPLKPMSSKASNQHARSYTVNAKKVGLAGAVVALLAAPAGAQTLTVEKARAIVTPFYEALNRPAEKDVVRLLE
jgi:hypothetical protein